MCIHTIFQKCGGIFKKKSKEKIVSFKLSNQVIYCKSFKYKETTYYRVLDDVSCKWLSKNTVKII